MKAATGSKRAKQGPRYFLINENDGCSNGRCDGKPSFCHNRNDIQENSEIKLPAEILIDVTDTIRLQSSPANMVRSFTTNPVSMWLLVKGHDMLVGRDSIARGLSRCGGVSIITSFSLGQDMGINRQITYLMVSCTIRIWKIWHNVFETEEYKWCGIPPLSIWYLVGVFVATYIELWFSCSKMIHKELQIEENTPFAGEFMNNSWFKNENL